MEMSQKVAKAYLNPKEKVLHVNDTEHNYYFEVGHLVKTQRNGLDIYICHFNLFEHDRVDDSDGGYEFWKYQLGKGTLGTVDMSDDDPLEVNNLSLNSTQKEFSVTDIDPTALFNDLKYICKLAKHINNYINSGTIKNQISKYQSKIAKLKKQLPKSN